MHVYKVLPVEIISFKNHLLEMLILDVIKMQILKKYEKYWS